MIYKGTVGALAGGLHASECCSIFNIVLYLIVNSEETSRKCVQEQRGGGGDMHQRSTTGFTLEDVAVMWPRFCSPPSRHPVFMI